MNFFFQQILLKYSNGKIDDLLETPWTSEEEEITADISVLIQFFTHTTKLFYAGKFEGKEAFKIM